MAVTTLATAPDNAGVLTSKNLTALNKAITDQNANNTSLLASIAAIVAGGFNATDNISALAGGAKPGTLLTTVVNRVTTVTSTNDSVSLPAATAGLFCVVINDAAKALNVFGLGTDTIDDVATATGVPVAATSMTVYLCTTSGPAGKWYSLGQWAVQFTNVLANNIFDTNGKNSINIGATASAVNGLVVTNAATGNPTILAAGGTGSDANAGLTINSAGTGAVTLAPGSAAGTIVVGGTTQTGDLVVGSSSGTQTTRIGNGAGIVNTNIAMVTTAGSTTAIAGAVTAAGLTDQVNIGLGNAAATAFKKVNIATGTPGTSGNNWVIVGGGTTTALTMNAVVRSYQHVNFQATESGANNALVASLVDAAGNNVTLAAGLRLTLVLAHTLQAGANTLNLNGAGIKSIVSSRNSANNIATGYAATGIIDLLYDGTAFRDMNQ